MVIQEHVERLERRIDDREERNERLLGPVDVRGVLFEVFQRIGEPGDNGGTGIGLAIGEQILHRRGGDPLVESEPGQGSTFFFTVPAAGAGEGRP